MANIVSKGIIGGMLFASAIQDSLYKKISLWIIVFGGIFTCISIPFCTSPAWISRLGGCMVGLGIILVSKLTGGKIGMGDGLLLSVMGLGLGLWENLEVFALALLLSAIVSIFLLTFRLASRKKQIAFVPFLLVAYIIVIVLGSKRVLM